MKILVSACLMGTPCRFDGTSCPSPSVMEAAETHDFIPICPEQLGGLASPRPPCEIDVSRREPSVVQPDGTDMTGFFDRGARRVLDIARENGCHLAILKSKSPSCGTDYVYDGTFSGTLVPGSGITARLLRSEGIRVVDERRLEDCTEALLASGPEDTPTLQTSRLLLRPISRDDAEQISTCAHDHIAGPDAGWTPRHTVDDTLFFIDRITSSPHVFGILDRHTGAEMGSIGLLADSFRKNTDCLMLGYALGAAWWGRGYATEAAAEVIRYGFEELGLSLVTANHFLFNNRSRRVIEKCGFVCEGTLRGVFPTPDGIMQDAVSYSLTKEEYFSLHGGSFE